MSENIPDWISKLALDIHKVIKEYNGMPRFRGMVNKRTGRVVKAIEGSKK